MIFKKVLHWVCDISLFFIITLHVRNFHYMSAKLALMLELSREKNIH